MWGRSTERDINQLEFRSPHTNCSSLSFQTRVHPCLQMLFRISAQRQFHRAALTQYLAQELERECHTPPGVNLPSGRETAQAQSTTTDGVHPRVQHHRAETTKTWKRKIQIHIISNSQTQEFIMSSCRNEELHISHKCSLLRSGSDRKKHSFHTFMQLKVLDNSRANSRFAHHNMCSPMKSQAYLPPKLPAVSSL